MSTAMVDSYEDKYNASFSVTARYLVIVYELTKQVPANLRIIYGSSTSKKCYSAYGYENKYFPAYVQVLNVLYLT